MPDFFVARVRARVRVQSKNNSYKNNSRYGAGSRNERKS